MQDYGDAVRAAMRAALADYSHCLLCGSPCTSVELYGARIRVCPCVENFPGRPAMVGINFGGLMEPKLTIEDLAVAASEAYQRADQKDRWTAAVAAVLEKLNERPRVQLVQVITDGGVVTEQVPPSPEQSNG